MRQEPDLKRRDFLMVVASVLGSISLPSSTRAASAKTAGNPSIRRVIDIILAEFPEKVPNTVDTLKSGDPDEPVRGIATTFLATCDVIERARTQGANLIITHEPTFYNHLDEVDWLRGDPVYKHKTELLKREGIAVWRFHDYWHRVKPDPVTEALVGDLGLESSSMDGEANVRVIPPLPLDHLAKSFKEKLGLPCVRVVGDSGLQCRRIAILPGAWGGRAQIGALARHRPDVLICGEIDEWETNVYIKDSISAGMKTGLILLGHVNTEEAGMRTLVDWLKPRFPDVPIAHVPMGDPFRYL